MLLLAKFWGLFLVLKLCAGEGSRFLLLRPKSHAPCFPYMSFPTHKGTTSWRRSRSCLAWRTSTLWGCWVCVWGTTPCAWSRSTWRTATSTSSSVAMSWKTRWAGAPVGSQPSGIEPLTAGRLRWGGEHILKQILQVWIFIVQFIIIYSLKTIKGPVALERQPNVLQHFSLEHTLS